MRAGRLVTSAFAGVALVATVSRAEFKLVPIDDGMVSDKRMIGPGFCQFAPDVKFDRLPDGVGKDVKCGRLALDGVHAVEYAVYDSTGGRTPDTLVFDVNGDKDLTNDRKFTGLSDRESKAVTVKISRVEYQAKIRPLSTYGLMVERTTWLKGNVNIDGKPCAAALIDGDGNGFSLEKTRDMMLIDLNGNGKFDVDYAKGDMAEMLQLQPEVLVHGRLYTLSLDTSKPDVMLAPFTGPQGRLALELQFNSKPKEFSFSGYLSDPKGMRTMQAAQSDFPIAMKVDASVQLAQGMLMLKDDSGKAAMLQFSMEKPLSLKEGKTTVLTIGDHGPLEAVVKQEGAKLKVSSSLVSKSGIKYGQIMTMPEGNQKSYIQPKGPGVRILDDKEKLLAEGSMEYG